MSTERIIMLIAGGVATTAIYEFVVKPRLRSAFGTPDSNAGESDTGSSSTSNPTADDDPWWHLAD